MRCIRHHGRFEPFLLSVLVLLGWVGCRLQHGSSIDELFPRHGIKSLASLAGSSALHHPANLCLVLRSPNPGILHSRPWLYSACSAFGIGAVIHVLNNQIYGPGTHSSHLQCSLSSMNLACHCHLRADRTKTVERVGINATSLPGLKSQILTPLTLPPPIYLPKFRFFFRIFLPVIFLPESRCSRLLCLLTRAVFSARGESVSRRLVQAFCG